MSQRGSRRRVARSRDADHGVAQAMRPAVARLDSWKPASAMSRGSARRSNVTAQPSAAEALPAAAGLARKEDDARHRAGAQDRRGRPGGHDVRRDRERRDDRSPPSREAASDGRDARRDDRDVPARDRHDVADPGRGEGTRDGPIDPVAEADEDPGGQPGLGLGQDPCQGVARVAPPALQACRGIGRSVAQLQRPGIERAPRPDAFEVAAVGTVRARSGVPVDDDPVAGLDAGVAGQRRGDPECGRAVDLGAQRRGLPALPRRPDALDHHRPRPGRPGFAAEDRRGRAERGPDDEGDHPDRRARARPAGSSREAREPRSGWPPRPRCTRS